MMPGLGGALLCQTMKNDAALAHIPFLMISGHPNPPAFVSYDGYLRKPVDMENADLRGQSPVRREEAAPLLIARN